jgi:DNA-binding MarR family transcriptional regulator
MGEAALAPKAGVLEQPSLHNGQGSQLTHDQLDVLVAMSRLDKTQVEIAQAIGCNQSTVSRYLKTLNPTGQYADAYLRANQGLLAEKFVNEKARGADILDLLERFETIPARKGDERGGIMVIVGGDAQVQINAFAPSEKV